MMNDNDRKIPLNLLCALALFAGLFGYLGVLLVAGYIFLADKRSQAKSAAIASVIILVVFTAITYLLDFINLCGGNVYDATRWIAFIKNTVCIVYAIVMLSSSHTKGTPAGRENDPDFNRYRPDGGQNVNPDQNRTQSDAAPQTADRFDSEPKSAEKKDDEIRH